MEQTRAEAQQRSEKVAARGNCFLQRKCTTQVFYDSLRIKYLSKAQSRIRALLSSKQPVDMTACGKPHLQPLLFWVEDLKQFLFELKKDGKLNSLGGSTRKISQARKRCVGSNDLILCPKHNPKFSLVIPC